ncbi:hepatic and glial cell adhesion molecule-like isoform X3 [Neoarius graeffei]|uniref:hepatic and glial cell adhesion molecule-like isoform X3 n=1 Tax=Neoarius graeffei TaxID=443677 RepID=UPI00298C5352|nr:hepatic and glial cell adhesion molecule-like isoform X3 [Neoarius graeffei]
MDGEFKMLMMMMMMMMIIIMLLNITVSGSRIQHVNVSCHNEMICALEASSVTLTCSYSNTNITTGFWFRLKDKAKWRKEEHPEDLALDSDYAGRVSYNLQVSHDSTRQALTCRTSCLLTPASHRYHWYKNGQYLKKYTANMQPFHVSNDDEGRYSCSFQGYNEIFSPPLCVGRKCWNVTYPEKRVCALEGSSVELAGSYSHPSDLSVSKVIWYDVLSSKVYQDLRQETQFTNRAEYVQQDRNFNLKMNQLTKKDSGEYRLRFYTNNDKGLSGRPGVVLKVTDLQVRVSESAVESVTLSCITSCTLSNNPTYLWYKNGQPVTNKPTKHNKLYLISSEDAGTYSCAVTGREDLRSPEQTVTRGDESSVEVWKLHALWGAVALVPGLFLSLLITVLCMKRKRGAKRDTDVQIVPSPGDDTYTELNSRTMSPDYDILQNVQSSASGTYTTLNPATMSSDYDTLRY